MEKTNITIEAINPVNKLNIETIINTISEMEGVSSVNLLFDNQYKFIFSLEYDTTSDYTSFVENVRLLLNYYSSSILSLKNKPNIDLSFNDSSD
ncbi:hypothetical protein JGH11_10100 [Dysgonomonas sp. Marseille-P4677]|uniref:hypothetical protein n=1 Tax=Dysgonomonas sp. Marseille-P4677 TaxID=2364790 RepID=UPI001913C497|nr:hypothetical protein [Dysgonomonas sp. Marseille-P4677]MBK5721221.1 hypothetical protein [Dysgonomonas sp. Marseille-P4677]